VKRQALMPKPTAKTAQGTSIQIGFSIRSLLANIHELPPEPKYYCQRQNLIANAKALLPTPKHRSQRLKITNKNKTKLPLIEISQNLVKFLSSV
jgi:hypothetical protein